MINKLRKIINTVASCIIIGGMAWFAFAVFAPGTFWYEFETVIVDDTPLGQSPNMTISRHIKRDFTGTYFVKVERYNPETRRYSSYCSMEHSLPYSRTAELPPDPDLAWWTYPQPCHITRTGKYRVRTALRIEVEKYPVKWVHNLSNTFKVY